MHITITELKRLITVALQKSVPELTAQQANFIADHYIEADVKGKTSHGIRKLKYDLQFYNDRLGAPKIIKDRGAVAFVDGQQEIGPLAASFCTELVIQKAQTYGIGLVCMRNAQRYGVLSTWTEAISRANLVGIVTNTCEPFGALHGAAVGLVGTNPLSISMPRSQFPLTFDASFTKSPMSLVWESQEQSKPLPENHFLDTQGHYTTDPYKAKSVEIFGGAKGSGLAFMLQSLTGPMLGIRPHASSEDPYQVGYYFQAFDPSFFSEFDDFETLLDEHISLIKRAPVKSGADEVKIPGEQSNKRMSQSLQRGEVDVNQKCIDWLTSFA